MRALSPEIPDQVSILLRCSCSCSSSASCSCSSSSSSSSSIRLLILLLLLILIIIMIIVIVSILLLLLVTIIPIVIMIMTLILNLMPGSRAPEDPAVTAVRAKVAAGADLSLKEKRLLRREPWKGTSPASRETPGCGGTVELGLEGGVTLTADCVVLAGTRKEFTGCLSVMTTTMTMLMMVMMVMVMVMVMMMMMLMMMKERAG